ncbi:MAG: ankyrin repeat domain-containing protein [Bacteroidales bacterium]|nr:ankyrin repeat domain-containing protein [Bacteroidales bacterium]
MVNCRVLVLFFVGLLFHNVLVSQDYGISNDSVDSKTYLNNLLILYCDSGNYEIAKRLIGYGANPNMSNDYGVTPLMYAVQSGSLPLVELLLENNANPNAKPYDGNTAMHAAVRAGNDSIADMLFQFEARVDDQNDLGLTPLHYAVWYGFPYLTDLLLYWGANADCKDQFGCTPLYLSAYSGAYVSSKLLLDDGADPNICNIKGVSPLMVAAQYNDTAMVSLLLVHGAKIDVVDMSGENALAYAIAANSKETVLLLMRQGAFEQALARSYYQIAAETENKSMRFFLDSIGQHTRLKLAIGNVYVGTATIFSNHEFMLGFNIGVTERVSKLSVGITYWYRPVPVATLNYQSDAIYQYKEKRQVFEIRVNRFKPIRVNPSGRAFGVYYGGNVGVFFRDFKGANSDPKTSVYPGLNAGFYAGGDRFRFSTGWEFTGLRTPSVTQHRVGVHLMFFFPVGRYRRSNILIDHVE